MATHSLLALTTASPTVDLFFSSLSSSQRCAASEALTLLYTCCYISVSYPPSESVRSSLPSLSHNTTWRLLMPIPSPKLLQLCMRCIMRPATRPKKRPVNGWKDFKPRFDAFYRSFCHQCPPPHSKTRIHSNETDSHVNVHIYTCSLKRGKLPPSC